MFSSFKTYVRNRKTQGKTVSHNNRMFLLSRGLARSHKHNNKYTDIRKTQTHTNTRTHTQELVRDGNLRVPDEGLFVGRFATAEAGVELEGDGLEGGPLVDQLLQVRGHHDDVPGVDEAGTD